MFIVVTNVVASRPPERYPTGTPHAWVNCPSVSRKLPETQGTFRFHEAVGKSRKVQESPGNLQKTLITFDKILGGK